MNKKLEVALAVLTGVVIALLVPYILEALIFLADAIQVFYAWFMSFPL